MIMDFEDFIDEYLTGKQGEVVINEDGTFTLMQDNSYHPEYGSRYFFIDTISNNVCPALYEDTPDHKNRRELGNCFKTVDDATRMMHRLAVRHKMLVYGGCDDLNSYDLEDRDLYVITCDRVLDHLTVKRIDYNDLHPFDIYFLTKTDAEQAIKKIGEDKILNYVYM